MSKLHLAAIATLPRALKRRRAGQFMRAPSCVLVDAAQDLTDQHVAIAPPFEVTGIAIEGAAPAKARRTLVYNRATGGQDLPSGQV